MVHDQLLDAAHIGQFKVLVFPNIAALSTRQCAQIRDFVKRGGSIVATHETSLYDEAGVRRADFGLADLFGASFDGADRCAHAELLPPPGEPGTRCSPASKTPGASSTASRASTPNGTYPNPPLTLIPSYPDLPMEEVFPRIPKTDIPEVFVREMGKSRVVYFPWDIDRTFWEVLSPDHGKLLRNAVTWAANEPAPVTVTGPGVLDVTIWKQASSMTVHLVNLTNPMMMKGPIREFLPLPPQTVSLKVNPKKVHLLVSGATPRTTQSNGILTVTIPSILDHEVVAIDL